MRKSLRSAVVASILIPFLAIPQPAFAWGNTGHEVVAWIAWQHMTPTTRAKVSALIAQVPPITHTNADGTVQTIAGHDLWVQDLPAGITDDQKQMFLFMRAATWADSLKHRFLRDSDNPATDPNPDSNIGFADTFSHGYWHFIDQPFGTAATATSTPPDVPKNCFVGTREKVPPTPVTSLPDIPAPNAATEIAKLRDALSSGETPDLQAYDLLWLEHLVGDVHQPLHGAVRFVNGDGDVGGNCVDITVPAAIAAKFKAGYDADAALGLKVAKKYTPPSELHAFWDSLPGTAGAIDVQFAAKVAATIPKASAAVTDSDPDHWAKESLQKSQASVYHLPIGPALGVPVHYTITNTYLASAKKVANGRLALAGERLANLLNATFDPHP